MQETSPTLLERLRQPHDQEAWGRFVRLYTPLLMEWARRLGLQEADASDLLQEVFGVLITALPQFRYNPDQSFRAWLSVVLRNKWLNQGRGRKPVQAETTDLNQVTFRESDGGLPFDELEYRSCLRQRALEICQREFQPVTWQAFWRTVIEGDTPSEVATELGITANAVYLARGRVLKRLREDLEGFLD